MPRMGEIIDNYTLADRLGTNAFGEVWTARESITNRLVRLNFLRGGDDYQVTRFTRAISLLSRLNHPAIVAHTGHGFHRHRPYLATEHVQGPTLATLMASGNGGRMDELRVLRIAAQIAAGLDHAWKTAEIIHRNLGPDTILVDLASMQEEHGDIRVKIIDFGHALGRRLVDDYDAEQKAEEEAFQRAAQQESVGTPLTMSPEQIRGARLTIGSDMYALGVTMHLLLTGAPPFAGTDEELRAAHLRATPLDLQQVVPGLQPGTAAVVRRLLAKIPDGRFPDWATFRTKLQPLIDQLERRLPPRQAQPTTAVVRKTATYDRTPQGAAVQGGIAGGGPPAHLPPAPNGRGEDARQDEHRLFALLADRLAAAPTPEAQRPSDAPVPRVDDGLSAEQRAAVWAFLFRNPAILEASVTAPAQGPETLTPTRVPLQSGDSTPARGTRRIETATAPKPAPALAAAQPEETEVPELSSRVEAAAVDEAPTYAELFAPAAPPPVPTAEDPEPRAPRNPVQSPFWKPALENLRTAVIGRVRYQSGNGAGITKRITSRLRRLVASRESTLEEIGTLLDAGRFDEAEQLLEKLATDAAKAGQAGNDVVMCVLRGRLFALRGDFVNSLRWAQNAVQQQTTDPTAIALVGLSHLQSRRVQTAIAIFDEAARMHPESPLGPIGQATVLMLAGLDIKANLAIDEADSREIHPAAVRLAALICRANDDVEGEIAELQRLLTGTSADWEINERLQELGGRTGTVAEELT